MARFRYRIEYRKGSNNERPDALSRRDHDKPKEDPSLLYRERQLINPITVEKFCVGRTNLIEGHEIFVYRELQLLWNEALQNDSTYEQILQAVKNGERLWSKDLKIQTCHSLSTGT